MSRKTAEHTPESYTDFSKCINTSVPKVKNVGHIGVPPVP
jgi:hypothetical protein